MRRLILTLGVLLCITTALGRETDTILSLVDVTETGIPLGITGTIYADDGKTPLESVSVYVYQTDIEGHYSRGGKNEGSPDKRNARIEGTVVTDKNGFYAFHTISQRGF